MYYVHTYIAWLYYLIILTYFSVMALPRILKYYFYISLSFTCAMYYSIRSNFQMTKFTKTIRWPVLQKDVLKIGGNRFKRYIMCANYEFLFLKNAQFLKFRK